MSECEFKLLLFGTRATKVAHRWTPNESKPVIISSSVPASSSEELSLSRLFDARRFPPPGGSAALLEGRVIETGTGNDVSAPDCGASRERADDLLTVNDTAGWLAKVGRLIICKRRWCRSKQHTTVDCNRTLSPRTS